MVGSGSRIGVFTVAEVAALMLVLVEVAIGMLLMEVLHITKMFPAFGTLDERKRKTLFWVFLTLIFAFASIEAGLAFMREQIAADNAALLGLLVGGETIVAESTIPTNIPAAAQMLVGFILPFVLIFVAIPFEFFLESSRILLGSLLVQILHLTIIVMRLIATIINYVTDILLAFYDIVVSIPLWVESKLSTKAKADKPEKGESSLLEDAS
jgi:hypothetical protein